MDIRKPIGLLFTVLGLILAGAGAGLFGGDAAGTAKNIGGEALNINLIWGLVLLVFGGLMLGLALRSAKNAPNASEE
ncbi:MAG: hypothetical protein LBR07_07185 [Puniceicoccales bacterium]|nr:hypothetical protein [Puniceicoccales bacterium]